MLRLRPGQHLLPRLWAAVTDDTEDPTLGPARDLRRILELAAHLPEQAIHDAADPDMPGGLALAMLAPVASPEARTNKLDGAERWNLEHEDEPGLRRDISHVADEDDVWEPPLQTLLRWSEAWRERNGKATDLRPTLSSECQFLTQALAWAAGGGESRWAVFVKDLRRAVTRMENTLHAGTRAQRTRVPCIDCDDAPRLIKVYGDTAVEDHYKCPACKARYTPERFALAKGEHLESQGAERYVRVQDARASVDRSPRTVSTWLRADRVRSYRDEATGQLWVWWPDIRVLDVNTKRRRRSA